MNLVKTDAVEIGIIDNENILTIRWLKEARGQEYRDGMLEAGNILLKYNLDKILLNNQKLGLLPIEDRNWLIKLCIDVISQSSLKRLAVISVPDVLQIITDEALDREVKQADLSFLTQYFISEGDALEWLLLPEGANELLPR